MDLSNSLAPPAVALEREDVPARQPAENAPADPMAPVHASVDAGLRAVYGAGWEAARDAIEAAAAQGVRPDVYARVGREPQAFGAAGGSVQAAGALGGALRVRDEIAATVGQPPGCPDCGPAPALRVPENLSYAAERASIEIRQRLTEGPRNPVDADDLRAIYDTLGARLTDAAAIVGTLRPDEMQRWMQTLDANPAERQRTFTLLAATLDAHGLQTVAGALAPTSAFSLTGTPDQAARVLGAAITHTSPPEIQADVVRGAAATLAAPASPGADQSLALVTAEVVGGLAGRPDVLGPVLPSLTAPVLDRLVDAGVTTTYVPALGGQAAPTLLFDAAPANRMLYAIGQTDDTLRQTAAFVSAGNRLAALVEDARALPTGELSAVRAAGQLENGMSHLFFREPNGIVERLRSEEDVGGRALTAYAERLIAAGNTDRLRQNLDQLTYGEASEGERTERLSRIDTNSVTGARERVAALSAGHYLGAVYKAFDDRRKAGETDSAALRGFLDAVALVPDPRVSGAAAALERGIGAASNTRSGQLEEQQDAFVNTALPESVTDSGRRVPYIGPGADEVWQAFEALAGKRPDNQAMPR